MPLLLAGTLGKNRRRVNMMIDWSIIRGVGMIHWAVRVKGIILLAEFRRRCGAGCRDRRVSSKLSWTFAYRKFRGNVARFR